MNDLPSFQLTPNVTAARPFDGESPRSPMELNATHRFPESVMASFVRYIHSLPQSTPTSSSPDKRQLDVLLVTLCKQPSFAVQRTPLPLIQSTHIYVSYIIQFIFGVISEVHPSHTKYISIPCTLWIFIMIHSAHGVVIAPWRPRVVVVSCV